MTERDIFITALQEEDPARRLAYLDQACAGRPELRKQVEGLLRLYEGAGSFLEKPALGSEATGEFPRAESASSPEAPGTVIGPYKLLERIGEGGMGTVWMAQQTEPVRRVVALKLIKAGMDSRQVIARFEAERQALALMDHANIARVLDAGTTGAGRPYFVMDLVKGVPITRFCDEHQLTPLQRLEVFLPVCHAVQHAHQKGVIHRDLKPSNVLVALYDGKPVPKVIDFGVAKAAGPSLTEKTLVTGFGAIVGTLEYMSPEQAQFNQVDVDTRSDIYTLGVLLYELLAGSPPFSRAELEKVGLLEMLRVIREQEPSRPSTRLSTSDSIASIAAQRHTEPAKLSKLVRGDLDWITLKCLEKDRARRYETANGLARDIQHYLNDEPVEASPPSAVYRFSKFLRRNKGPVLAASLVLLTLLAGIAGTTWGLLRADQNRRKAERALNAERQARDQAMIALRLTTDEIVQNQMARGYELRDEDKQFLRKILKHFEGFAAITSDGAEGRAIRAEGHARVGLIRHRLGELKDAEVALSEAVRHWRQLAVDFPDRPSFREELANNHANLGILLRETGRWQEAKAAYTETLTIYKRLIADFPANPDYRQGFAQICGNLGNLLADAGQTNEAETACADAVANQRQLAADFPDRARFRRLLATSLSNLGTLHRATGQWKKAEDSFAEALSIQKQLVADYPGRPEYRQDLVRTHSNMGILLRATARWNEAEAAYTEALAICKGLAADFPAVPEFRQDFAETYGNLGNLHGEAGRTNEAEAAYAEALALGKRLAADFPNRPEFRRDLARSHSNLGDLLRTTGRLKKAEDSLAEALVLQKQLVKEFPVRPEFHQDLAGSYVNMGIVLRVTGRMKEAETAYAEALAIYKRLAAAFPPVPEYRLQLTFSQNNLARLFRDSGRPREAEAAYSDALAIQKRLVADFPTRPEFRLQLARTHNNLGLVLQDLGRLPEAEAAHADALTVTKQLTADDPTRLEYRQELASSHNNLGIVFLHTGRLTEAQAAYADAATIRKQLAADFPKLPDLQHRLAGSLGNLAILCHQREDFSGAKGYLEDARLHHRAALKANPKHPDYRKYYLNTLRLLASTNASLNDPAATVAVAQDVRTLGWDPSTDAYHAARILAQCIPVAQKDKQIDAAQRKAAEQLYADQAMELLRDAVAKGWKDAAQTSKDPDLDPLRRREDFQRLLKELDGE